MSSITYIRIAKDTLDPEDDWITGILQIVIANFEIINIATNTTLIIIIRSMQKYILFKWITISRSQMGNSPNNFTRVVV